MMQEDFVNQRQVQGKGGMRVMWYVQDLVCGGGVHLPPSLSFSTFDHIRPWFPHIFDQTQSLHEFLSTTTMCTLRLHTFVGKVLEHWESLLIFTCIMWKYNIFGLIGYTWPPKTIIKSLSLSLSLSLSFVFIKHHCANDNAHFITRKSNLLSD